MEEIYVEGHVSVILPIRRSAAVSVCHAEAGCGKEHVNFRKHSGRDVLPGFPTKQCQLLYLEPIPYSQVGGSWGLARMHANTRLA